MTSRVVSIRDIDYELNAVSSFHPALLEAGKKRILNVMPDTVKKLVESTLLDNRARTVWAIHFERNNAPLYTIRNLAFTELPAKYRRVLRISV